MDIPGSYPKQLHMSIYIYIYIYTLCLELDKPIYGLTNKDIQGSEPDAVKFKTGRLGHNPIVPDYKLSQVEERPATPPKYIRDNMGVSDIPGARPAKPREFLQRDIMKISDIHGAQPKKFKVDERSVPIYSI